MDDLSSSFKGKSSQLEMPMYSSRHYYEANRSKNALLKKAATFSYLLLQLAIIGACGAIFMTPYWMRCHFFVLTPETANGTIPDFTVTHPHDPFSVVFKDFAAQTQDELAALAGNETLTQKFNLTTKRDRKKPKTTTTTTTASPSTRKLRRTPPPSESEQVAVAINDTTNATTTLGSLLQETAEDGLAGASNNTLVHGVMRRYVSADIGLWETCQLGRCQAYGSLQKIFFEIDQATWWLFICRWICLGGIALTEIMWFIVAAIRFIVSNRRQRRRPRISIVTYRNRHLKKEDPKGYTDEPISGALLIIVKFITMASIAGALMTFRWHTNTQWPVEWRTQNGVIAHMGLSWLAMVAMGGCDAWLFLVTLLHTIATRRDRKRAAMAERLEAIRNGNGVFSTSGANAIIRPRDNLGPSCGHARCGKFCAHRGQPNGSIAPANSEDDSNYLFSPSTTNNFYKPTPYEDDFGFSTIPMSRKASMRKGRHEDYAVPPPLPVARALNPANRHTLGHRTPGRSLNHRYVNHRDLQSPESLTSPSYLPHFDDEAIGGRAFY